MKQVRVAKQESRCGGPWRSSQPSHRFLNLESIALKKRKRREGEGAPPNERKFPEGLKSFVKSSPPTPPHPPSCCFRLQFANLQQRCSEIYVVFSP